MLADFRRDLAVYHQSRWPGRVASVYSRLMLLASSRGLWVLLVHRCAHHWQARRDAQGRMSPGWRLLGIPLYVLEWLSKIATKCDIFDISNIEGGVYFSNRGYIIFGARHVGRGTVIGPCSTIGMSLADSGLPSLGNNVYIGANCVVYGAISIGDGATLLPGTVLTKSVPAGVVMQGNPARLLRRDFDNQPLRACPDREPQAVDALLRGFDV